MTIEEIKERMAVLRKQANLALLSIPKDKWGEQGAVNWGDIGVCDVRWWCDERGESGYTVTLEEAAPDAKLGLTIWKAMGVGDDVEIVCEW